MNELIANDVVVGSGPTGWAACMGIWARGGQPLVIDIGYTSTNFSGDSVMKNPMVMPKSRFGSGHMYAFPLNEFQIDPPNGIMPLSGALGGFSTVWGAGIQPVSEADLVGVPASIHRNWLISSTELLKRMDFLGRNDLLSHRDPWPVNPHDEVVTSPRFQKILNRADFKRQIKLQKVLYGSPRLAITGSKNRDLKNSCTLCGQCMSGCPEDSIFDAGQAIHRGILEFGGNYVDGLVTKISAANDPAARLQHDSLLEVRVKNGSTVCVKAKHVYLAAGAIGTPILLQKSGLAPPVLDVRDSQMFYGAFVSFDKYDRNKPFMTTSQGYFTTSTGVALKDELSMSVYEYSDEFKNRLEQMVPRLVRPFIKLITPITRQIVPGIGFLSQDVSGLIRLTFDGKRTTVSFLQNPLTKKAIRSAKRLLGRTSRRLGLMPIPNPFATPSVGAGFHAGASMPMGDLPDCLIDWDGRLKVAPSIQVVDATSLMRIKAGSHTFMAMANAFRIASQMDSEFNES
jgi:hypothetical protein